MIHIDRGDAPSELTEDVVHSKTAAFKAAPKKVVWRDKYIVEALMNMSHNKCAYCECKLGEESKYMEVEHFHDKKDFPDEVVLWNNLLPSCKKCNTSKGDHNTVLEPIINPSVDVPQQHMILFRGVRFRGIDDMGKKTIVVLNLNDQEHHCKVRYAIGQVITEELEKLLEDSIEFMDGTRNQTSQGLGRLRNSTAALLSKGTKDKEYSAVVATALLSDDLYASLKANLQQLNIWTDEMNHLEAELQTIRYKEA